MTEHVKLDIHQIMDLLPHRYPFLLVDRVLDCVPGDYLHAIKNVTANEPFFTGHFPQRPVMPGVIMLEAMAQATGLLAFATAGKPDDDTLYYLVGIDKVRFRRPVEPGDQLQLHARLVRTRRNIWMFEARAEIDGEKVSSAEMMCAPRRNDS
ncbi:MAG: 3-hydroxyacyl-ACP dehydratase FabZ [Gammaproteobacteria bacterium]|nr:3-hydroxyacyl-ACP dehydratase FabZ [Gammaproteobacteria bacterium]NND60685.1 3-hydroxyacyl-ACP dehydratase FabZ [Gammaproteobacteria bacterium]